MAEYDLTGRLSSYLDRHMVLPLLEFLSDRGIQEERALGEAKLELLRRTNMVDFMMEMEEQLGDMSEDSVSAAKAKREEVVAQLKALSKKTTPIVEILEKDEVAAEIQASQEQSRDGQRILSFLTTNFDFKGEMLEQLYAYAKFQYDCGNYQGTSEYLYWYRILLPPASPNYLNSLWGKWASEILLQNWDVAKEDFLRVKAYVDSNPFDTELEGLTQRAWLIHWALFIFFNHPKGRDDLADLLLAPSNAAYLSTVQILCPHILRYLAVAVVSNRKKKAGLKELLKLIQLEAENYSDPVTEFLQRLLLDYDFDAAQEQLRLCESVLENDFFLTGTALDFFDAARHLVFEMFCRIHHCIRIQNLGEKLGLNEEEAERWIVNLIRNAALDARIDSAQGTVIMGHRSKSLHDEVMEATKRLSFRAQSAAFQLEKFQEKKDYHAASANKQAGY